MARNGLALVTFTEPEELPGDHDATERRMNQWSAGQKECRGKRWHIYKQIKTFVYGTDADKIGTRMTIRFRCHICRCRFREADFVRVPRGLRRVTDWTGWYEDYDGVPYLLDKGMARLDEGDFEELNGMLYLKGKMTFVPEED